MKKLCMVLMVVLLACAMTFSASAAVKESIVDVEKWNAYIRDVTAEFYKKISATEYPYHIVVAQGAGDCSKDGHYQPVIYIFSKTRELKIGDKVRIGQAHSSSYYPATGECSYNISVGPEYAMKALVEKNYDLYEHVQITMVDIPQQGTMIRPLRFSKLLEDYSTATIAGQYSVNVGFDWIVTFQVLDISRLEALLAQAKAIEDTGYRKSTWSRMQAGVTAGDNLLLSTGYKQPAVDAAADELEAAINGLMLLPTVPDLRSRIASARAIEDVGYTAVSWQSMQSAIVSAQALLDTQDYDQARLTAEDTHLSNAINALALELAPPPVDEGRYLVDGITVTDLMPAKNAIFENLDFGRTNGRILFALLIGVWLIPAVFRRMFSIRSEERFIDRSEPTAKSAYYRDIDGHIYHGSRPTESERRDFNKKKVNTP